MSNLLTQCNQLIQIDQLIRLEQALGLKELCIRTNLSISTVRRRIQDLEDLGAPISYCYTRRGYYYRCPGKLKLQFERMSDFVNTSAQV